MVKILLSLIFMFSFARGQENPSQEDVCRGLLDYIASEMTVKNMRLSVERLNKKMVLAFVAALKNSEEKSLTLKDNPELVSLFESMKQIDPDFEKYLERNEPYRRFRFWSFLPWTTNPQPHRYQIAVRKWKQLQETSPALFEGLGREHRIDEWDLKTATLLENYTDLEIKDPDLRRQVRHLGAQFLQNYQNIVDGNFDGYESEINKTKSAVDRVHQAFNESSRELFWASLNDFGETCSLDKINSLMTRDSLSCPYVASDSPGAALSAQLRNISHVISSDFINANAQAPEKPEPAGKDLEVLPFDYQNINYDGNFCERDPKLADTVVVHHSGTRNNTNPQEIHDNQVVMHENDRDAAGNPDPWYMIAYNYVIKAPYESGGETPSVYQGRPDRMKGAHAGAFVNLDQVDPKVRRMVKNSNIQCGWNTDRDQAHRMDRVSSSATALTRAQIRDGYVSANITSVGLLVLGNYAPDILNGRPNPGGYPANGQARYPTEEALRTTAKLVCKLKNGKYPNLRKITDHNYIKIKKALADGERAYGTCCPGTVYRRMDRLLQLTKEECPQHNFALDISPEDKICSFLKDL